MTNMFAYFFKMNLKRKYIKLVYNNLYATGSLSLNDMKWEI